MSLKNDIRLIREEMLMLLDKLEDLQQQVDSMETQNLKLLDRMNEKTIMNEGDENLMKLYNEGYHICPTHFAKSRDGEECLLCMAFLNGQRGY